MTQLSKAAAREKYLDRYWEKKAAEKPTCIQTQELTEPEVVSISRSGMTDEQYISALGKSAVTIW